MEITVNGEQCSLAETSPHTNLLDFVRDQGFIGAKEGCAEGECGACAVLVARPDGSGSTRWTALNACLPPALAFDGQEVVTAEGLGEAPGTVAEADLHPVQQEMAARGGSQCGYCTPGFICAMADEYYRPERGACSNGEAGSAECGANGFDLHALSGNLCRCTGYRPIKDAAYALGDPSEGDEMAQRRQRPAPPPRATHSEREGHTFYRPESLGDLVDTYSANPEAVLAAGCTDYGVEVNIRDTRRPLVLSVERLAELRTLDIGPGVIEIGAGLTLTEIERELEGQVPLLAELFPLFASRLIRNSATLGGNIATASPIGDSPPVLLALGASLVLASTTGEREVELDGFFTAYRQTQREPGEIIRAVRIPLPQAEHSAFYKIAKRRFDDISSIAVGIAMDLDEHNHVADIKIGVGGAAATPLRAHHTEKLLLGQPWDAEHARLAAKVMVEEGSPMDDHRASSRYRSAMLEQALLRFHAESQPTTVEVSS